VIVDEGSITGLVRFGYTMGLVTFLAKGRLRRRAILAFLATNAGTNQRGEGTIHYFDIHRSGARAVLVGELNFCGDARTCIHGVNCATGYTHQVEIYVRRGNVWRKSFSVQATEPTFLSVEPSENLNSGRWS
jgi:hypothetical protein